MKANRAQIERAWGKDELRLVLLYGPDEAGSREIARALSAAIPDAERTDLTGADLRGDPARLADEAAAISLFGGRRIIRVDPAGDETLAAAEALLEAGAAGNPVILVAGALRKESKLLKLALASPLAMALASYVPEGRDADRIAISAAAELGLAVRPDVAHRLALATGGDRALLMRELEKYALYLDTEPARSVELTADALDALEADASEADVSRLIDAVLLGRGADWDAEQARLDGGEGVLIARALLRRLLLLAQLRSEVGAGNSVDTVIERAGKSLFWKDRPVVARQLGQWNAADLARAITRAISMERDLKSSGAAPVLADQTLVEFTRLAARNR